MAGRLADKRILIVEDEYFIAADLKLALQEEGAEVIGPVGRLDMGLVLIDAERLDVAVLDVNLAGEASYPIAEKLRDADVPCLLVTGYDGWAIPESFRQTPKVAKPFAMPTAVKALVGLVAKD